MRSVWTEAIKKRIRPAVCRVFGRFGGKQYLCPVCEYEGPFLDKVVTKRPRFVREDSKCPNCTATERHRLLHLVLDAVLEGFGAGQKSVLHVAPEPFLEKRLRKVFQTYHSMDLYRSDVDFQEDIQCLGFESSSYEAVVLSRVLISPRDLTASVRECRRVLKPGGIFIVAEYYPRESTIEYPEIRGDRFRELGVDAIDLYREHFDEIELFDSNDFAERYQLFNRTHRDGVLIDDYPALVRAPEKGLKDVVGVCRVAL